MLLGGYNNNNNHLAASMSMVPPQQRAAAAAFAAATAPRPPTFLNPYLGLSAALGNTAGRGMPSAANPYAVPSPAMQQPGQGLDLLRAVSLRLPNTPGLSRSASLGGTAPVGLGPPSLSRAASLQLPTSATLEAQLGVPKSSSSSKTDGQSDMVFVDKVLDTDILCGRGEFNVLLCVNATGKPLLMIIFSNTIFFLFFNVNRRKVQSSSWQQTVPPSRG